MEVSDELLAFWQEREAHVFNNLQHDPSPLPLAVRAVAVQYLARVAQHVGSSQNSFFQAIQLIDTYCTSHHVSAEQLPVVCAAIVGLLMTIVDADARASDYPSVRSDVSVGDILHHERAILASLSWSAQLPTAR